MKFCVLRYNLNFIIYGIKLIFISYIVYFFFRNFFCSFLIDYYCPAAEYRLACRGLRELLKGLEVGMVCLFMKFCAYWKKDTVILIIINLIFYVIIKISMVYFCSKYKFNHTYY